jgi:hypothetical protein
MTLRRAEAGTFYVEQNFQILSPKKTIFCHSNLKSDSLTNTFIKIVILSISSISRNRMIELKFTINYLAQILILFITTVQ